MSKTISVLQYKTSSPKLGQNGLVEAANKIPKLNLSRGLSNEQESMLKSSEEMESK